MSTLKGNSSRSRAQKYQNRRAFKNDLHDKSPKIKLLNSLQVSGVCGRCKDKIEWKIKYKKYKTLTAPKKCVKCSEKSVKHAYHVMCLPCARKARICAKCCKSEEETELIQNAQQNTVIEDSELQVIMKSLPERKRRTLLRYIKKQNGESSKAQAEDVLQNNIPDNDILKKIESLKLSARNKEDLDNFDFGSDEDESDSSLELSD